MNDVSIKYCIGGLWINHPPVQRGDENVVVRALMLDHQIDHIQLCVVNGGSRMTSEFVREKVMGALFPSIYPDGWYRSFSTNEQLIHQIALAMHSKLCKCGDQEDKMVREIELWILNGDAHDLSISDVDALVRQWNEMYED